MKIFGDKIKYKHGEHEELQYRICKRTNIKKK